VSDEVLKALAEHDARSDERAHKIRKHIDKTLADLAVLEEEAKMSESVSDKINIHTGGGDTATMAALMAAMNGAGGGQAGLVAAMNAMGNRDGFGQGGLWPLILLALFNRGGGLFGGVAADGAGMGAVNNLQATIDTSTIMKALGDIQAAVPLASAQVQNSILQQTIAMQQDLASGFSNLGDKVTSGFGGVGAAIGTLAKDQAVGVGQIIANNDRNGWAITTAIQNDGDKTRALITAQNEANLQRQLSVAEAQLAEQRSINRSREIEVNVSQNVNQNQMQMQQQQQLSALTSTLAGLANQINRSQQDIIAVGSTLRGIDQNAANTNIR